MDKQIRHDGVLAFIIPLLYLFVSWLGTDEFNAKTILLLFFTSSFSVFLSYVYVFNDNREAMYQFGYGIIAVIGVALTLVYDSLAFAFNNFFAFTLITIGLVISSIYVIWKESKKEWTKYYESKRIQKNATESMKKKHSNEVENLKVHIKTLNDNVKGLSEQLRMVDLLNALKEDDSFDDEQIKKVQKNVREKFIEADVQEVSVVANKIIKV